MLAILSSESDGSRKFVFREKLRAVKVVEPVLTVIPASNITVIAQRVTDNFVELAAAMAVLCGRIADGNSF